MFVLKKNFEICRVKKQFFTTLRSTILEPNVQLELHKNTLTTRSPTPSYKSTGTSDAYKAWNQQDCAWVDMRLHESYDEGRIRCPEQHHHKARCAVTTKASFVAFLGTLPALAAGQRHQGSSHLG